jgi:hypothetical protein
MHRVKLSVARMTGVHWINGALRDVAVSDSRVDLTSFRFTGFHNAVFDTDPAAGGRHVSRATTTRSRRRANHHYLPPTAPAPVGHR